MAAATGIILGLLGFIAFFAILMAIWAACTATAQYLEEKRATRTGDFLLEDKP